MTERAIVVWSEITVTDLDKSVKFYDTVFGYDMKIDSTGPNPMAALGGTMNGAGGHLYPGKPAADGGNTIHLGLPDTLEAGMKRCTKAGGQVLSPPITIPIGRFAYAKDIDGNSIGLFEAAT